jgi:predicted CXXCH cytochrome family protein
VDVAEHFALVGVTDKATRCQSCHNPHEPLFLDQPVSKARIHPLIHPCRDCHAERGIETKPLPDGHVVTFRCGDCHGDVVADAAGKAHGRLDCRTCHVFHKDSEFSGRILKNGNPRFCLMCHQDRPFVAGSRIPHIASLEAHVAEMASSDEDKAKRCADCHLDDAVHRRRAGAPNVVAPGGER